MSEPIWYFFGLGHDSIALFFRLAYGILDLLVPIVSYFEFFPRLGQDFVACYKNSLKVFPVYPFKLHLSVMGILVPQLDLLMRMILQLMGTFIC